MNVYKKCPVLENEKFCLRLVSPDDCEDLLEVYSDIHAVPFFNSDNCNGDDFHYQTLKRMNEAIDFWIYSYNEGYFVRWTIIDRTQDKAVGTIELFNRESNDYFNNCGILRLDLHSSYENAADIKSILSLIIGPAYDLFSCNLIATKATQSAKERRVALIEIGFTESTENLIGHDGRSYDCYFEIHR